MLRPSPSGVHQRCVRAMLLALDAARPPGYEVMVAPWDWVLWERPYLTIRQPDLVVVRSELADRPRLSEPPLLAVEVLSEDSFERDTVTKKAEYARAGLAGYWLVDPDAGQLMLFRRSEDHLQLWRTVRGPAPEAVDTPFPIVLNPVVLTGSDR